MKSKLILLTAFAMLLCSCASSDLSSENNVTTTTTKNELFTTSTSDLEDDEIVEIEEAAGFSFDYSMFNKRTFEYNGEEISFDLGISTSVCDCGYAIGLLCDGKLLPLSIDGSEYDMTQNVLQKPNDKEMYTISFKPYGVAGETAVINLVLVADTNAKPLNDYNFQSAWCGFVSLKLPTGYVTLNVDGIDVEESSKNAEITEISQEILDYYTEQDEEMANLSEDGTLTKTLETNNRIDILDPDVIPKYTQSWAFSNYMISDGQLEFDALFYGQPNKVSICCWSDKGFLPVFDGKYTAEVELEEYYQQAKIHCKLEDESFGDIERIEMIVFDEDRKVYLSGATGVITSQTYEEFLEWCESLKS